MRKINCLLQGVIVFPMRVEQNDVINNLDKHKLHHAAH